MKQSPFACLAALTVALCVAIPPVHAQAQPAGDLYAGLKTYDFANREPVFNIWQMIRASHGDRDQLGGIETGLIGVLQDPGATFAGKQEACRMLWEIGTGRSVPALSALLTGDPKLSNDARFALERNTDPAAGRALRDALASATGPIQIGLINSVGDRHDGDAVNALKPLAASGDATVSAAAIAALGKIATPAAVDALHGLSLNDLRVARALVHAADRMAADGHKRDAERVYSGLAAHGPAETQADALHGLLAVGSGDAVGVAVTDLKSSDGTLQVTAAGVVTALGADDALAQASTAYPSLSAPVQTALIAGFGARGYTAAGPLVESAMTSADPALRMAGIRAAGRVEGAAAVPALARLAASGDGRDKREARLALAQIPGMPADDAILKLSRSATDPAQRTVLIEALAQRQSPAYRASLLDAARGGDEKVAVAAIKSLSQNGQPTDDPALVTILTTTKSDSVRDAAGDALAAIGSHAADRDTAAQPLIDAFPSASAPAKADLIPALAQIGGPKAIDAVAEATMSSDADVKAAALSALADTSTDPEALKPLWNLAKTSTDKPTRVQALRGYLRILTLNERMPEREKFDDLKAAMGIAERPEEKKAALSGLRECRTAAALDLAAANLDDPAVFDEAADAVLVLSAPTRRGNRNLPAVKSPAKAAALDKIIALTKDDGVKVKAQALKGAG